MKKTRSPEGDEEKITSSSPCPSCLRGSNLAKFRARLIRWFQKNGRDLPWRRTRDPYAILVSEIMCQQTQVATVVPYFERWMQKFPDVRSLAKADEQSVLREWQGLGYYSRARNLHHAAQQLVDKHAAQFPRDLTQIRALPGVGRYTAGAVANFAFDEATPIVDANIARVLARLLDLQTPIDTAPGAEVLWKIATVLQPPRSGRLFNSALMELGALICTPRAPKCTQCPVATACRTSVPETLPRKKPRRAIISLVENCAFVFSHGKVLLEQQTPSRWRGLWKLPPHDPIPKQAARLTLTYPFTHHRVRLSIFKAPAKPISEHQQWHPLDQLPAMPSPHLRALRESLLRE